MAIYRVVTFTVHCDKCNKFVGSGEGRQTLELLESVKVLCADCDGVDGGLKS